MDDLNISLYTQFKKDRYSRRDLCLLVAFFVTFLLVLSLYCYHAVQSYLDSFIQNKLSQIQKRIGQPVHIQSTEIGKSFVHWQGISVGEPASLLIDDVKVSIDFNPLSDAFLEAGKVDIGTVRMTAPIQRGKQLEWLQSFAGNLNQPSDTSPSTRQSIGFLPKEIAIKIKKVVMSYRGDEHTRLESIQSTAFIQEKKIVWRALRTNIEPWLDEHYLEGRLVLERKSEPHFTLRRRDEFSGVSQWGIDCNANLSKKFIHCDIESATTPLSLTKILRKKLGESFNPGWHGSLEAKSLNSGQWMVDTDLNLSSVVLNHPSLSTETVGPFDVSTNFQATIDLNKMSISSKNARVDVPVPAPERGIVRTSFDFDLKHTRASSAENLWDGDIHASLPQTPCNDLLRSIPAGFANDLTHVILDGHARVDALMQIRQNTFDFRWNNLDINCYAKSVPEIYSKDYLNGPFVLERSFASNQVIHIPVDPSKNYYVALKDTPLHVVNAVLTAEDAGFWQHTGIEPTAIAEALERNAKEGRAAVGGSTITMQTAKNLFLSRDKTLSRKLQEVMLASHLEKTIGKNRILEIYLNIAEFGPHLYGIGAASQRFFKTSPKHLSIKQAVYLASLLPAPVPRYQNYCRGSLTANYESLVGQRLLRMLALNRITEEQYNTAASAPLNLGIADNDPACEKDTLAKSVLNKEHQDI